MTNIITMRNELSKLYNESEKIRSEMARNQSRYIPAICEAENRKLEQRLKELTAETTRRIGDAGAAAVKGVEASKMLTGTAIDDNDMKLLSSFNLDAEQLTTMLAKYTDNETMTAAISQYAQSHGLVVRGATPESKTKGYNQITESAIALAKQIGTVGAQQREVDGWCRHNLVSGGLERDLGFSLEDGSPIAPTVDSGFNFNFAHIR